MTSPETPKRLTFVYQYRRQGESRLWRPSQSHMIRRDPREPWAGSSVTVTGASDSVVEVTVNLEIAADEDEDDSEWEAAQQADAAFRSHVPEADLGDAQ